MTAGITNPTSAINPACLRLSVDVERGVYSLTLKEEPQGNRKKQITLAKIERVVGESSPLFDPFCSSRQLCDLSEDERIHLLQEKKMLLLHPRPTLPDLKESKSFATTLLDFLTVSSSPPKSHLPPPLRLRVTINRAGDSYSLTFKNAIEFSKKASKTLFKVWQILFAQANIVYHAGHSSPCLSLLKLYHIKKILTDQLTLLSKQINETTAPAFPIHLLPFDLAGKLLTLQDVAAYPLRETSDKAMSAVKSALLDRARTWGWQANPYMLQNNLRNITDSFRNDPKLREFVAQFVVFNESVVDFERTLSRFRMAPIEKTKKLKFTSAYWILCLPRPSPEAWVTISLDEIFFCFRHSPLPFSKGWEIILPFLLPRSETINGLKFAIAHKEITLLKLFLDKAGISFEDIMTPEGAPLYRQMDLPLAVLEFLYRHGQLSPEKYISSHMIRIKFVAMALSVKAIPRSQKCPDLLEWVISKPDFPLPLIVLMLERGAHATVTTLCRACSLGHEELVCLLLNYDVDILEANTSGIFPLQEAVTNKHLFVALMLLKKLHEKQQDWKAHFKNITGPFTSASSTLFDYLITGDRTIFIGDQSQFSLTKELGGYSLAHWILASRDIQLKDFFFLNIKKLQIADLVVWNIETMNKQWIMVKTSSECGFYTTDERWKIAVEKRNYYQLQQLVKEKELPAHILPVFYDAHPYPKMMYVLIRLVCRELPNPIKFLYKALELAVKKQNLDSAYLIMKEGIMLPYNVYQDMIKALTNSSLVTATFITLFLENIGFEFMCQFVHDAVFQTTPITVNAIWHFLGLLSQEQRISACKQLSDCLNKCRNAMRYGLEHALIESFLEALRCPLLAEVLLDAKEALWSKIEFRMWLKNPSFSLPKTAELPAIHEAAQRGEWTSIRFFVRHGISVNVVDPKDGQTALYHAVANGRVKTTRWLLTAHASVKFTSHQGTTPLHAAMHFLPGARSLAGIFRKTPRDGLETIIRSLLTAGAPIDARDAEGRTPLLLAAELGNVAAVSILIALGAHVSACTKYGENLLHCAQRSGKAEVVNYIIQHLPYPILERQRVAQPLPKEPLSEKKIIENPIPVEDFAALKVGDIFKCGGHLQKIIPSEEGNWSSVHALLGHNLFGRMCAIHKPDDILFDLGLALCNEESTVSLVFSDVIEEIFNNWRNDIPLQPVVSRYVTPALFMTLLMKPNQRAETCLPFYKKALRDPHYIPTEKDLILFANLKGMNLVFATSENSAHAISPESIILIQLKSGKYYRCEIVTN